MDDDYTFKAIIEKDSDSSFISWLQGMEARAGSWMSCLLVFLFFSFEKILNYDIRVISSEILILACIPF
jgi:hypothetical protein